MPEHEVSNKKQQKAEESRRISLPNPRSLSPNLMTLDISSFLTGDMSLSPPVRRHVDLLSEAPSAEVRAVIAGQLQRTYGNQYVQRLINSITARSNRILGEAGDPDGHEGESNLDSGEGEPVLATELTRVAQPGLHVRIQKQSGEGNEGLRWNDLVKKAKNAFSKEDWKAAERLYRQAIIMAASAVTPPKGVEKIQPKAEDILVDFKFADHAQTEGKKALANEDNYWRWFRFGPRILIETQAHTESVIFHEMVHVRQYKKMLAEFKKDTSPNKEKWEDYQLHHSPKKRALGPEEMEAHITGLDYLKRESLEEQRQGLQGIFTAYILTTSYIPPKGENLGLSASAARPLILDFYKNAGEKLQQEMGDMLWRTFLREEPSKETWKRVIQDLKPVAVKGYSVKQYQKIYDDFLKDKGLDFRKIISETGTQTSPVQRYALELACVPQQGLQSPLLQKKPDEKAPGTGDLELPWKHGDYSLFEEKSAGIRFLVGVSSDKTAGTVRAVIPAIGKRIAADNSRIKNPSSRVMVCFIVPTTTRFALWGGKPALALDPSGATAEAAAHEMGHALFYALESRAKSRTKYGAQAGNFRLRVGDIYLRLSHTKEFNDGKETHPAGLWIADPSQWGPGRAKEHPWQDPDEFFASAKEAYQVNRKGFESAIARFKKLDPAVGGPAKELLALLDAFLGKGALPSRGLPGARVPAAEKELERATGVSNIEDTVMSGTPLDWLLNPGNRPKPQKAVPSITSPY